MKDLIRLNARNDATSKSSSFGSPSRARLSAILGSASALSLPVIAAYLVVGFSLSFEFLTLVTAEPWLPTGVKALATLLLPCALLFGVRAGAHHRGWSRPRIVLVLVTLSIASILRSTIGISAMTQWGAARSDEVNPVGRTVTSLLVTLGVTLTLGAAVHLARERSEARAVLLAEQRRLRELVEQTDESLRRAETELRSRASELLAPTISEIRVLLQGDLSNAVARDVSARITEVVDEVVRPTSRQLADSPSFALRSLDLERPAVLQWLSDRLDVTKAIRPGLVWVLGWLILAPGLLIIGPDWRVVGLALSSSLVVVILLYGVKSAWPKRRRRMSMASGLGILALIYFVSVAVVQSMIQQGGSVLAGHAAWSATSWKGLVLWVALAFLVSVLAMLDEHGRQNRASLAELNVELEELVARLRREVWLLHRSVALAVHGPVQSALVSTAMRLSATDRTADSVNDARRRLDQALTAIEHDHHEVLSIDDALADLIGLWNPAVKIRADVWPSAETRLAGNPGLRRCVIEICREATSNAIRHGHAALVDISLVGMGETIVIRVSDEGDGVPASLIAGLGSSMLDDTCLRWALINRAEGGAELTAHVV